MSEPASHRNTSIDLVRGVVMVIMALDHTRDYFTSFDSDPTDLSKASAALFLTRFVTHYCAPVFVFLAGTSAYLSRARGKSVGDLTRFLITRGLWLVLLELTIVRFCWLFDVAYHFSVLQVIWAIGWSMVVLAGLIRLPTRVVALLGFVIVCTHNLLDGIHARTMGSWGWAWSLVHEPRFDWEPVAGHRVAIIYPLVPWIGVMALGYALGSVIVLAEERRRRVLLRMGLLAIFAFIVLRAANVYGDPRPWQPQASALFTGLSFLNCEKYPPSLIYLLMTLGPALVALSLLERAKGAVAQVFIVYGRVPLFYYVLHIFLIHTVQVFFVIGRTGHIPNEQTALGFALPWVYATWMACVCALYPLCRWFAGVKSRARGTRAVWLSYL